MKIIKRTFKALDYPKFSAVRDYLNENPITSKYDPQYPFVAMTDTGEPYAYLTQTQADDYRKSAK